MTDAERPWCCPEPRCVIGSQGDDSGAEPWSVPQPGRSFTCFGRAPREVTFVYDGVDHANDLNVCLYAPTKGMLRFQMNAADLWILAGDFLQALKTMSPDNYEAWGPPDRPARLPASSEVVP